MGKSIVCPKCHARYTVADDISAEAFECPSCGTGIRITPTGAPPAAAPAPAKKAPASPPPQEPAAPLPRAKLRLRKPEQGPFLTRDEDRPKPPPVKLGQDGPIPTRMPGPEKPVRLGPLPGEMNPVLQRSAQQMPDAKAGLEERQRQREQSRATGRLVKRLVAFVAALVAFAAPMIFLQIHAARQEQLVQWVLLATMALLVLVCAGLLISSLIEGFLQFFLVVCLPGLCFAIIFTNARIGIAMFALSLLYVAFFVLFRAKSWFMKGMFLAFVLSALVTGPYFLRGRETVYTTVGRRIIKVYGLGEESEP
ncbi:MAG: hypothetical protein JXR37_04355 [Kiritimatiellae bacterium]|nr:hypothetical protein [Kiritimatiellia bacterium]